MKLDKPAILLGTKKDVTLVNLMALMYKRGNNSETKNVYSSNDLRNEGPYLETNYIIGVII